MSNINVFDVDTFQHLLHQRQTSVIGRKVVYTEVTGSTMDDARRLAHNVHEYPHGTVVMSEVQTKARGARDKKWDASNTGNIYVSVILHKPPYYKTFEGKFDLEVAACLAVLQVVRQFGVVKTTPKWPNDLWVKGHKVAGFLAEDGRFDIPGSCNCLLILGMGINVNADVRRSSELQSLATSLLCERGGVYVNREELFAEICIALEQTLENTREDNLTVFTQENLFQENCDISVTGPTLGKVIDAKFLEICENWEIKFRDILTDEVLQGRSDYYVVRPRVENKILVVFSGIQSNKSANNLSKWLTAVVDTSRYVVCLVPETSITGTDKWMKTCSLLVLAEHVSNPEQISRNLSIFLKSGGRVMASGMGSLFLAKLLDIPLREVLVESSQTDSEVGFVRLQKEAKPACQDPPAPSSFGENNPVSASGISSPAVGTNEDNPVFTERVSLEASTPCEFLIFPTNPVCFQFFADEKALLSEDPSQPLGKELKGEKLQVLSPTQAPAEQDTGSSNANSTQAQVKAYYVNMGDKSKTLAVFTAGIVHGGSVALWGFDIGVTYPSNRDGVLASEVKEVDKDRFERDLLLQEVLQALME